MPSIEAVQDALREVAPRYRIQSASLFGSCARGEQHAGSDVDILLETTDGFSLLDAAGFRRELSACLGTDVDIVSRRAISGPFAQSVLDNQMLLYECSQ